MCDKDKLTHRSAPPWLNCLFPLNLCRSAPPLPDVTPLLFSLLTTPLFPSPRTRLLSLSPLPQLRPSPFQPLTLPLSSLTTPLAFLSITTPLFPGPFALSALSPFLSALSPFLSRVSLTLSSADTSIFQHHPPCPEVPPFSRGLPLPSLTLSLHPNLVQEGRLQVEELGHDVESKEVAVDPLSTHRCLQQGLVLVQRQAEQGEALWVLGSPGRSQVMERQEVGLLLRPVTPPASTQLATSLQGRDINSILQKGNRHREGKSLAQGHTARQNQVDSQGCLTLGPKLLPLNHNTS